MGADIVLYCVEEVHNGLTPSTLAKLLDAPRPDLDKCYMGPAGCLVLVLGYATLLSSTPAYGHNVDGAADAEEADQRLDVFAAVNLALRMSATLGLLWLLLLRLVPPLAVFSPWLFNGMGLTVARSSTDAVLDALMRWACFGQPAPWCSPAEPLQHIQSLG